MRLTAVAVAVIRSITTLLSLGNMHLPVTGACAAYTMHAAVRSADEIVIRWHTWQPQDHSPLKNSSSVFTGQRGACAGYATLL